MVLQGERSHSSGDALICVQKGDCGASRIGSVEMGDIGIPPHVPCVRNFIPEFGIPAVLFKLQPVAVAVRSVIRSAHHAREASLPHPVGGFCLQSVVRAIPCGHVCFHAVILHLAGHDVDHAAHCVRAIQHGSWPPQNFHPFCQERLVSVSDGMPEQPHVLGMPVDKHHQPTGTAAHASQGNATGRPVGSAEPHDAPLCGEQPRHLFRQHRYQRRLVRLLDGLPVDDRNSQGQMPDVCFIPGAGHHHLVHRIIPSHMRGVGLRKATCCQEAGSQCRKNQFFSHYDNISWDDSGCKNRGNLPFLLYTDCGFAYLFYRLLTAARSKIA